MQRHFTLRHPATAGVIALVASVAIAACGGSSPGSSAGSNAQAGLKFAACVRAHGVPDYPDAAANGSGQTATNGGGQTSPPPGKADVNGHILSESTQVVDTAYGKCQKYSLALQGPVVSSGQLAGLKAGALAYAKCVRAHGVPDFPDPTVETGPGGRGAGITPPYGTGASARTHARSPTLQAAINVCGPLVTKYIPGAPGTKG